MMMIKELTKALLFLSLGSHARLTTGKCLDMSYKSGGIINQFKGDFSANDGVWYEAMRDKMTMFEATGKCNRNKIEHQPYNQDPKTKKYDYTAPIDTGVEHLDEDGKEVMAKDGFHVVQYLSTS